MCQYLHERYEAQSSFAHLSEAVQVWRKLFEIFYAENVRNA